MLKKLLLTVCVLVAAPAMAQEVFWGFDEDDNTMIIPQECDNAFYEGGTQMNPEELYEIGMHFLEEPGYVRQGAGYCLLAAAQLGNVDAQYQVAQMYHKGLALPKSDLAAYKWATLAALNGHKEADQLGASIEQFLSIDDIQVSTNSLGDSLSLIRQRQQNDLEAVSKEVDRMRDVVSTLNQEVLELEHFGRILTDSQRQRADLPSGTTASLKEEMPEDEDIVIEPQTEPQPVSESQTIFSQKHAAPAEESAPEETVPTE